MSTATKGRRREHQARAWLEGMGYLVTRSAGSKGAWDLIGVCRTGIVLVQSKCNEWPAPAERKQLEDFPAPDNARKLLVRFDDRQPLRARELLPGRLGPAFPEWRDIE